MGKIFERGRRFLVGALLFSACGGETKLEIGQTSQAIQLPTGFRSSTVANVPEPTAFAFLPDGRMLVTSRSGRVRVIKNGQLLSTPAIDLSGNTCPERERGMLGVQVDPDFASNRRVYVYYTRRKSHCELHDTSGDGAVNRVSRFTYDLNTDRLSGETVILDHLLSYNGWHNGGDLQFGQDGYLYVTIGDWGAKLGETSTGWNNNNSRHKSLLAGKVLRIDKNTGAPAPGNPWLGAAGSRRCGDPGAAPRFPANSNEPCQETFAWGLRNPFRIARKPGSNTFFANDVGQNIGGDHEEVDELQAGADYGWNRNQGPTDDGATTDPIYSYEIGEQVGGRACRSITGGAFVPDGAWPDSYQGAYFFGDYVCGALFYIKQSGGTWRRTTFATDAGASTVVHMGFGPNPDGGQSLYYTSFDGKVVRIDPPAATNNAPTALVSADPTAGAAPLSVRFDGSDSFDNDPNDGIGSYIWNFGDGSAEQTTTAATVTHTYAAAGEFTARLTVEDRGTPRKRASATVPISAGNERPTVLITSPRESDEFVVDQPLSLEASATDEEDGSLGSSSLSWIVKRIHDDHTHPFFSGTGNGLSVSLEGPEGLAAAESSRYSVTVVAMDSGGLTAEETIEIEPHKVELGFRTSPEGLSLRVDDTDVHGEARLTSWEGYAFQVRAPTQVLDGKSYQFKRWSDGNGSGERTLTTPGEPRAYTAEFEEGGFLAKINFQADAAITPEGYYEDNGAVFGAREAGLEYGWNEDNQFAARERNNPASPDKRYDTTVLMQKEGNKFWEIALPNGDYDLLLVAGDADYSDSVYDIMAEGTTILSGTPTDEARWVEARTTVTVSDGRLTLDNGPTAQNNRVCFIDIASTPPIYDDEPDPGGDGDGDGSSGDGGNDGPDSDGHDDTETDTDPSNASDEKAAKAGSGCAVKSGRASDASFWLALGALALGATRGASRPDKRRRTRSASTHSQR